MTARTFTVERLPRRAPDMPKVPLTEPVRSALGSIADDLRHAPRDVFLDRAELVHWLGRMARRVDGVAAMTTAVVRDPRNTARTRIGGARPASAREIAEAVFGKRPPAPRTITSRKGRAVRVETRRARGAGQFEMEV